MNINYIIKIELSSGVVRGQTPLAALARGAAYLTTGGRLSDEIINLAK